MNLQKRLIVVVQLFLLAVMVGWIYGQTLHFDFLTFDDDVYVTQNAQVQNGLTSEGIRWAFTTFYASNWHPVTWLSHMLDHELFGLDAGWQHLGNILLHLSNTILLYFLARYLLSFANDGHRADWSAFLVAALFGVHPLHVESVAWISERKDLLCTLWGFASIFLYAIFVDERYGRAMKSPWIMYSLSLFLFLLSLMSKPMLVTLPVLLLLIDFWPLQRYDYDHTAGFSRHRIYPLILEKIPYIVLAAASCIITIMAQKHGGSLVPNSLIPLADRLQNAAVSLVIYLSKTIWPTKLAVFYPYRGHYLLWQSVAALLLFIFVTWLCWSYRRKKPFLLMGWLWYLVAMLPVVGIIQVGEQAMADRYIYIPLLGIFFIFTHLIYDYWRKSSPFVVAIILLALTFTAHQQTKFWQNQYTLFKHAVAVTENNYVADFQLGNALAVRGDLEEAAEQFRDSLAVVDTAKARNNLAYVLERQGKIPAAIREYKKAIKIAPANEEALYNLGLLLLKEWRPAESRQFFQMALTINPDNIKARENLIRAERMVGAERNDRKSPTLK